MVFQQNQLEFFPSQNLQGLCAGTDEAGRGCLAGPVVAACVVLPQKWHLPNLTDSKKLSPAKREKLAAAIRMQAKAFAFGIVWPALIDKINILRASLLAMANAFCRLGKPVCHLYVDGCQFVPDSFFDFHGRPGQLPIQKTFVHGDSLIPAISAASILAKTFRDAIMLRLDKKWPQYGFARHKGYGTKFHYYAIRKFGPTPMHRLSFHGVLNDARELLR